MMAVHALSENLHSRARTEEQETGGRGRAGRISNPVCERKQSRGVRGLNGKLTK